MRASPTLPRFLLGFSLWLGGLTAGGHAHDAHELTMNATVRERQLDLVVTLAAPTGLRLLRDTSPFPDRLDSASFRGLQAHLVTAGSHLFTLTSVTVARTREDDIEFTLRFPRPPAGRLRLQADVPGQLGPGHGGILEASDTAGHHLGWDQFTAEQQVLDVIVPALPAPIP